jgi:hypothetical protein
MSGLRLMAIGSLRGTWPPHQGFANAFPLGLVGLAVRNLTCPLLLAIRHSAGWREAAAPVQTVRTLVVFGRPEMDPRVVPPPRLNENSVEEYSADSLSPPLRDDE